MSELTYTEATLCFPIRGNEVLLAEKQKKIGTGFLNGFGGKKEPQDKDIIATNRRETQEEVGIAITSDIKVGEILFHNPSPDPELKRIRVHIFTAKEWHGEPRETDEMKSIGWHSINGLDFSRFLPADRLFLPQILGGKSIRGVIEYNDDWSVRSSDIHEVTGF